jgi:uroporphyrin-III C-methyltransferase
MSNEKDKEAKPREAGTAASSAHAGMKGKSPGGKEGEAGEGGKPDPKAHAQGKKVPPPSAKQAPGKPAAPGKKGDTAGVEARPDTPVARPAYPARGQTAALLIATLAFLLSLGVGGAVFYLWQEGADEQAAQARQLERLDAALDARDERLSRLDGALARETAAREELAARADARLATVEQGITRLQDRATRQERGWQVAEVKHLQRIAGHRLRLMDDPEGARRALQAADELLAELGDPRLMPVREVLAAEIQALEDMPRPDVSGIALRLERLAGDLRPLPLKGQAVADTTGARELLAGEPVDTDAPWWARAYGEIREALAEHVSIRRHAEPLRALPDAETELFLRQLLTLRVEAARVAALRLDDVQYQRGLEGAITLLDDHFDTEAVASVRERLEGLRAVTLRPQAPDISGSFTRLDELED